jgi:hypothetical protein
MNLKRIQLTLFVEEKDSAAIEQVRSTFNSAQYNLIKSHVTLCRENELTDLEKVIQNLLSLVQDTIKINFGAAVRFSDGKGLLMPALGANEHFHAVRKLILKGIISDPVIQEPHITLIHPRNGNCTDEIFEEIKKIKLPDSLWFNKISLIEQVNGGKWNVLNEFELADSNKVFPF